MKNHETEKKHPPEKVIFMNMCMLCDGDNLTECFEELQPDGSFLEHLF